jgi:hypothetical protein
VILHELAHTTQKNEGAAFTSELAHLYGRAEDDGFYDRLRYLLKNVVSQHASTIEEIRKKYKGYISTWLLQNKKVFNKKINKNEKITTRVRYVVNACWKCSGAGCAFYAILYFPTHSEPGTNRVGTR